MALFQMRPQATNPVNYVTPGLNKTIMLVGLGNIGAEYDQTRHNIGFEVIDAFVDKSSEMGSWISKKDLKAHIATGQMGDTRVIAVKPTTFMNLSGEAVQVVSHFYLVKPAWYLAQAKEGFDFCSESKNLTRGIVVERLDSKVISGAEERLLSPIPDGKGKVSQELLRAMLTPFFVSGQDQLAIR